MSGDVSHYLFNDYGKKQMPQKTHPAVQHVKNIQRLWSKDGDEVDWIRAQAIVTRLIDAGFIKGRVHNGELAVLDEPERQSKGNVP